MKKAIGIFRTVIIGLMIWLLLIAELFSQASLCEFDIGNPTLSHAREFIESYDYYCATEEIKAVLELGGLDKSSLVDGYFLLSHALYGKKLLSPGLIDDSTILGNLVIAFSLDTSAVYGGMVHEGRSFDSISAVARGIAVNKVKSRRQGKWYKKWWAFTLGVGIVAGAAVLISNGGGDTTDTTNAIPGFPPPPSK